MMLLACTVLALVLMSLALYALGGVFCVLADLVGWAVLEVGRKLWTIKK